MTRILLYELKKTIMKYRNLKIVNLKDYFILNLKSKRL